MVQEALRSQESKVAMMVTVPGEIPVTMPREFTVAMLESSLVKTGFSSEVIGLMLVSRRVLFPT